MDLKNLGHQTPHQLSGADSSLLERVRSPMLSGYDSFVTLITDEFSSLCPATGGPDFGTIIITYVPRDWIVESKSMKYYLESFRNEKIFHERVVAQICDDLNRLLDPAEITVSGEFKARGGLRINPVASRVNDA